MQRMHPKENLHTMEKRRVLITGAGAVTPIGQTVTRTWQAMHEGVCGVGPITTFDASDMKCHVAAEVKNWDPDTVIGKKESRHMARFTQFAFAAYKEAIESAAYDPHAEADPSRCAIVIGSGIGGMKLHELEMRKGIEQGFNRVSPFYIPSTISNMAGGQIAIDCGFTGMCACPVTACATGTNAVGDAFRYIRDGYAEVALCGGTEATIEPLAIGGFTSMRALHIGDDYSRASIPFDKERDGFVLGEGAGILLLEEYEHAMARHAPVLAEVVGYGPTCDAYHMTAPEPEGRGAAEAMRLALSDAGISDPSVVDYINAHGTSTPLNDKCETIAVKKVFGDHAYRLAISSTKSMTGHMVGGGGGVEAIVCALAMRDGYIPPTINYRVPDPECDLDIVPNEGRDREVRYALSNSFGFGGHNASLLLKRWEGK